MEELNLYQKIFRISSEISVKKDGKNPFYKSEYITLDNLIDKLQPLLEKYGVIVFNVNIAGGVKTTVTDGKEGVSSEFSIGELNDPQALGKVITYGRRYNLTSIFNIVADEDDDAQSFYEKKQQKTTAKSTKSYTSWFQNAISNVDFMKQCLDEDDFIGKIKSKYELDEIKEGQLRSAYQKAVNEDTDLPFGD